MPNNQVNKIIYVNLFSYLEYLCNFVLVNFNLYIMYTTIVQKSFSFKLVNLNPEANPLFSEKYLTVSALNRQIAEAEVLKLYPGYEITELRVNSTEHITII